MATRADIGRHDRNRLFVIDGSRAMAQLPAPLLTSVARRVPLNRLVCRLE
jgi:hypothetical protein